MKAFTGILLAAAVGTGLGQTTLAQAPEMLPYTTIDHPEFVAAAAANFVQDDYIVLGVATGKVAKAFPAADLAQHGSALDEMPDGPITVTWCGVCNVGAVYRRNLDGRVLHFDYDSMVNANEVQKDRETGSRWQQALGEAIDGPLKGKRLKLYPFTRTTWGEWRKQHPDTLVMKPMPGYAERLAGMNKRSKAAYVGEGEAPAKAFGKDYRLRPRELVAGLETAKAVKAYPLSALRVARVVNDRVGGMPVLVVHQPESDTTTAFDARAKGRLLRFEAANAQASELTDLETQSRWNAYGLSTAGKLKGTQLQRLILVPEFWFAWSQFRPKTEVFQITAAQGAGPVWEPLLRAPLPEDSMPKVSVLRLRIAGGRAPSPPHQHAGPVFAYLAQGRIENQVDPDPVRVYEPGGFFYEAPMHVHRMLHNLSATEPAEVLVFMAGDTGSPAATANTLLRAEPLTNMVGQELSLQRLTLGPGTRATGRPHAGPGLVYVLEGKVETVNAAGAAETHGAGELVLESKNDGTFAYRNASNTEPAKLLLFQVTSAEVSASPR